MSNGSRRRPALAAAALVTLALLTLSAPATAVASPTAATRSAPVAAQAGGTFRPAAEGGIEDAYVVLLALGGKEEVDKEKIDATTKRLLEEYPGKLGSMYYHALPGFAVRMPAEIARALSKDPEVAYVEQQLVLTFLDEQVDASWALDATDQHRGMDDVYHWDTDGSGVNAYVLDSGIRRTHRDFDGRVLTSVAFGDAGAGPGGSADCNGHGTLMAGAIGGRVHGTAKNVRLHSIRLGCVEGTSETLLAAVDWLAVNAVRPAVANFSFQGPASAVIDNAALALISRGISVVAAAGNSNDDACRFSPGRLPAVITVGAVHLLDRYPTSSWGACVDLFAPGDRIPTTANASDTATADASQTSPATALVTGAVARYLQRFPAAPPSLVQAALRNEASRDQVTDHRGSPNLVLYVDPNGPGNDGFGRTGADVNGDGRDDIVSFQRGTPADVHVALSTGSGFGVGTKWHEYFGAGQEIPLLGDVNGDGRDDLITFTRGSAADVYVALSTGTSFGPSQRWHTWFAAGNETPVVGDFNGDGRDDIATVTRGVFGAPSVARTVYVALSDGGQFVGTGVRWSDGFLGGDAVPMAGDFDCDGRDDLVAFERGGAGRVLVGSSLGDRFGAATLWGYRFALGAAAPAVGDFNGDGCDDVAEFSRGGTPIVRVATSMVGYWAVRSFGDPTVWHRDFASGATVPGAGDFTGDGRDDVIAFTRGQSADVLVAPSTGTAFATDVRRWNDSFAAGTEVPMPAVTW
ncbi:S8 family serine peptidase [Micromonospora peucetia]|uniref:S8 family serine peptidase n=1 Tax=Micromonospora peucetia TaxID=47871 RepID=UPI002257C973|nr:S8 family serine peptidase [Micromonospora peucetia]MCX4390063.1 S8 family serine peptidase [Micromonospora peucetia]